MNLYSAFLVLIANFTVMGLAAINYLGKGIAGSRAARSLSKLLVAVALIGGPCLSAFFLGSGGFFAALVPALLVFLWLAPTIFKG